MTCAWTSELLIQSASSIKVYVTWHWLQCIQFATQIRTKSSTQTDLKINSDVKALWLLTLNSDFNAYVLTQIRLDRKFPEASYCLKLDPESKGCYSQHNSTAIRWRNPVLTSKHNSNQTSKIMSHNSTMTSKLFKDSYPDPDLELTILGMAKALMQTTLALIFTTSLSSKLNLNFHPYNSQLRLTLYNTFLTSTWRGICIYKMWFWLITV